MQALSTASLAREAEGLLVRLAHVRPFSLTMTHVASASPSRAAWDRIELHLSRQRAQLRRRVRAYLSWLRGAAGRAAGPREQRRRFTVLRLGFNAALDQVDIFADVISQRAEIETGTWLAGLDVLAVDSLQLSDRFFEPPPLVTYLDRGHGAAIRRMRTRLPGGSMNPVAVVRVPRERILGTAVASSLVHEAGHQGAALLGLVPSIRAVVRRRLDAAEHASERAAWSLWERWTSELLADFWAVAQLGVCATTGLFSVLDLPHAFVLRIRPSDPHPAPWIRARLSCSFGRALYPDSQWQTLARLWHAQFPIDRVSPTKRWLLAALERTMPELVERVLEHRPGSLWGSSLAEVMPVRARQPDRLRATWAAWQADARPMYATAPSLVLAVLGQACWDGALSPSREATLLARVLRHWALRRVMPVVATPDIRCSKCSTFTAA